MILINFRIIKKMYVKHIFYLFKHRILEIKLLLILLFLDQFLIQPDLAALFINIKQPLIN